MKDNTMVLTGWICLTNANIFAVAADTKANLYSMWVFIILMFACWIVDFYAGRKV